ncbi:hypothetical protein [Brevundimonas faecalis]|uniref:Uncharacterized protein n=1 Tax=Brevundimonas faecalis TaxID=947378 RepID=A0ABV2RAX1_9CAUL
MIDPRSIEKRHPRLLTWCAHLRQAGLPIREIAQLFNASVGDLIEAGIEP